MHVCTQVFLIIILLSTVINFCPIYYITAATQEAEYAARLLAALGLKTERVTG